MIHIQTYTQPTQRVGTVKLFEREEVESSKVGGDGDGDECAMIYEGFM